MFDFNGVGIKEPEDLQEAFRIETSPENFKNQFLWMVERWGIEDSLIMLGHALFGNPDLKGLIAPTQRFVADNPSDPGSDYHLEKIK